ncbi:MAG: phosphoribosylglycinamide formyltransferase [Crocinitomicaceae bacterium]
MKHIAVFGSGTGSNAENIIQYFNGNFNVEIGPLVSNTPKSRFKVIAENNSIEYLEFDNETFANQPDKIVSELLKRKVDFIVLAGFLRKIHPDLIHAFSKRIINVHPSLLPKYGGRGMYGMKVHEAVLGNKETESGITVHFVNDHFDEGEIIEQKRVNVQSCSTADEIRAKVQELEQMYFPQIIENIIR